MKSHLRILCLLAFALTPAASQAGPIFDLFRSKPKVDPAARVPVLIATLTNEKDERIRQAAADELPNYDPKQFPEIPTALIHALQNDAAPAVRTAAINSLGKLRAANQEAGYALEQAEANDASPKVRAAATAALRTYKVLGYNSGKPADPKYNQSEEPPLAAPYDTIQKGKAAKPVGSSQGPINPPRETPKTALPVKAEPKREGLFNLPSWLGGKEREKEAAPPKPPVLPREPKVETPAPPLAVTVPTMPAPLPPSPVVIPPLPAAVPPVEVRIPPVPATAPREESRGPSLEPPK